MTKVLVLGDFEDTNTNEIFDGESWKIFDSSQSFSSPRTVEYDGQIIVTGTGHFFAETNNFRVFYP